MLIDEKIIKCEYEYIKCFTKAYENESIIRYRDEQLVDMYYHNYTYIKSVKAIEELEQILQEEIKVRLEEKFNYCNFFINSDVDYSGIDISGYKAEISKNGYYVFDASNLLKLKEVPRCIVKKVDTQKELDDILSCDLQNDGERLGVDFCTRRCYRRGRVYLAEGGVNSYVCYHNGQAVGSCDLFIYKGAAKLEDFSVVEKYQRRGYGTTILRALIEIALRENCHTIYLATDEDDTAKEMYKKLGFNKIGDLTNLFFKL